SKLYTITRGHRISKIYLDYIYPLATIKRLKIFLYPYKNNYTLLTLPRSIFHSTFFTTSKITILLNSEHHKHFFQGNKTHLLTGRSSGFFQYTQNSKASLSDQLFSILFKIKLKKYLDISLIEKEYIELLEKYDLIKIINKRCYLTKTSRVIVRNLLSPVLYIKIKEFVMKNNDFDSLCIYLLYLLNYQECAILWGHIKRLVRGEIEVLENTYSISAGTLFNVLTKLFNILSCLEKTNIFSGTIKYELLKMSGKLKFYENFKLSNRDFNTSSILKTGKNPEDSNPDRKEIILDPQSYCVWFKNKKLSLPVGAFKLLYILVENQNKLLPYRQIYTLLYNREDPLFKYTLINEKSYLCKKLKTLGIDTSIIENIAFTGYRLNSGNYSFKILSEGVKNY
ncbi:MAG: hypothetical protein ACK4NF_03365, partial [Planctomycetota bacterium]